MLFQRFFPQNISLLPKIVTEAHADLKKKKTSCNTSLKHYAVMVKYTPNHKFTGRLLKPRQLEKDYPIPTFFWKTENSHFFWKRPLKFKVQL